MWTHRDLRGNILIFKAKPKYEDDIIPVILWYLFALWVYPAQLFQKAHVWNLGGGNNKLNITIGWALGSFVNS